MKGQFRHRLLTNTFSGSDHEDANKHIEKVLEIVDLFHIPNITINQVMLRAFPMSLTGAASRWLRNEPTSSITTWDGLKTKFLNKYCPPGRTAKKMEEINNFQQEPDENLYQAWERFKELLMKSPQHYLMEMHEKWLNGTSRLRSTETFDGLAAIQAQLNNLGREIKKVNEKVYAAQVGCEQCKGPHYTKDCPLKEEGKTLEEAYYTQFGGPFQGGGYRAAAPGFYQRNNANPSYQERRQSMEDTLSKFMSESAKRHEENSNLIKEIRASTDAAIRNQGASIKTLEIQIGQMSKVLQERGFGSLPSSTEANPRDQVKSISTTIEADSYLIRRIGSSQYAKRRDHMDHNSRKLTLKLHNPYPERRETQGRKSKGDDLIPTIEEGEVIEEFRTRDDELDAGIDDYPSYCDYDKKIHIDCAHNLKFSCMIGFEFMHANFFPLLYVNVMSKKFHNSIMKEKMVYKGNNVIGALMNVPIFVRTFSVVTDFVVLENIDDYRDEGMGDVIFSELRELGIKTRWFVGIITIYNGNDEVTYQMVRSHPRFKHHTNEQCNKIPPLLKVREEDKMNGISHPYQKLKGFYKGVLNLGPDYIRDAKMEEWLTRGHISMHEME
ncbi:homeodomain-like protein [Tanacetum coccineum]